jgi:hypothetical protein
MKKALLVGINYYGTSNQLNGCINDVQNIRNMLIDAYGYCKEDILMLRDDLIDQTLAPAYDNILNELNALADKSSTLEEIWFHYSGHGAQVNDLNGDEISKLDNVIMPSDYLAKGVIVDDMLFSILKKMKCRVIMLFDSCHSGTVCDLEYTFQCKNTNSFQRTIDVSRLIENKNIYVISACKDDQATMDVFGNKTRLYYGIFTETFLECLRDMRHHAHILQLYGNICNNLKANGYKQIPIFSSTNKNPIFEISNRTTPPKPIPKPKPSPQNNKPPQPQPPTKRNMRTMIAL